MKRKTIYSILITTILMGAIIPLQTQAVGDTVTWHTSLDDEAIAWRITEEFLFDPADPPSLAGEDLYKGDLLAFEVNDTLPTLFDDVYNSGHPPNFLKLFVNYQEVSFYDVNDSTEPAFLLQFLIIPYEFTPAATGVAENITQFLEYRASLDPNITAIDYAITGGNYVTVSIFNNHLDSFIVTYNNDTGICTNFFIEDDFGEMFGQLDIWESGIDGEGVEINNQLNFHANLGAGTTLAWEYTEITYDPSVTEEMQVNNVTLEVGHVFKFVYSSLPIDPLEYYGGGYYDPSASFFEVFFETDPMEMTHVNRGQLILWSTLINPLSCTLYNGTLIAVEDVHIVRDFNDPDIENTTVSTSGDYMTLGFDIDDEWNDWAVELEINTISGITKSIAVDMVGFVYFEMEFVAEESTVFINGEINEGEGTHTLPGFNWFYLIVSIFVVLPILRRRKK